MTLDFTPPPEYLAQLCGVTERTARRWRSERRLPHYAEQLVRLQFEGELHHIAPEWRGWRIDPRDGMLITPNGYLISPGDLLAIPYQNALIAELERKVYGHAWDSDWQNVVPLLKKG